ncbi:hypothetical protein QL285_042520 [Trifolium repens]|nr:hypothetical protein QL285_042520 [Trifolium repens]
MASLRRFVPPQELKTTTNIVELQPSIVVPETPHQASPPVFCSFLPTKCSGFYNGVLLIKHRIFRFNLHVLCLSEHLQCYNSNIVLKLV